MALFREGRVVVKAAVARLAEWEEARAAMAAAGSVEWEMAGVGRGAESEVPRAKLDSMDHPAATTAWEAQVAVILELFLG